MIGQSHTELSREHQPVLLFSPEVLISEGDLPDCQAIRAWHYHLNRTFTQSQHNVKFGVLDSVCKVGNEAMTSSPGRWGNSK